MISRASTPQRLASLRETVREACDTAGTTFDLTIHTLTPQATEAAYDLALGAVVPHTDNIGQHVITNLAIKDADDKGATHLLRLDDDVKFATQGWLAKMVEASNTLGHTFIISPTVKGLMNPPARSECVEVQGIRLKFLTQAIGGICRLHHMEALCNIDNPYTSDVRLPLGSGDATGIAKWIIANRYWMVYLDGVIIKHRKGTAGQMKDDPSYHSEHDLLQALPYIPAWVK